MDFNGNLVLIGRVGSMGCGKIVVECC
jgi:hypothetical protein